MAIVNFKTSTEIIWWYSSENSILSKAKYKPMKLRKIKINILKYLAT
jgi:hypothetical protein